MIAPHPGDHGKNQRKAIQATAHLGLLGVFCIEPVYPGLQPADVGLGYGGRPLF